ncbi:MAG: ORF1 [XiangYun mono-chu-like virus 11]|nr:MAG: ORF1 [XiangYun mono-chu-like virus 11]
MDKEEQNRDALKADLKKLRDEDKTGVATETSTPEPTDWDPEKFKKEANELTKYKKADSASVIGHCRHFWAWYAGAVGKPSDFDKMYCAIIGSIENGGYPLLHKDFVGTEENVCDNIDIPVISTYKFHTIGTTSNLTTFQVRRNEGVIAIQACIEWVNAILKALAKDGLGTKEDLAEEFNSAKKLTALVLLNCCRLVTKEALAVQDHIAKTIVKRANTLFAVPMSSYTTYETFAPPSHNFIVQFGEIIRKGAKISKTVMTRMIYSCEYAASKSDMVKSVYRTGCLLSLSYTGLAPISWLMKAAEYNRCTQLDLVEKVYVPMLERFVKKYVELNSQPDQTWVYCRLIDDTALLGLSALKEPLATATFVALCYDRMNPDEHVWTIPSLSCISYGDLVLAHILAASIAPDPQDICKQDGITTQAQEVMEKVKKGFETLHPRFHTLLAHYAKKKEENQLPVIENVVAAPAAPNQDEPQLPPPAPGNGEGAENEDPEDLSNFQKSA